MINIVNKCAVISANTNTTNINLWAIFRWKYWWQLLWKNGKISSQQTHLFCKRRKAAYCVPITLFPKQLTYNVCFACKSCTYPAVVVIMCQSSAGSAFMLTISGSSGTMRFLLNRSSRRCVSWSIIVNVSLVSFHIVNQHTSLQTCGKDNCIRQSGRCEIRENDNGSQSVLIGIYPAGTHLAPKTSSRQRLQDIQNVNSEDVHKT